MDKTMQGARLKESVAKLGIFVVVVAICMHFYIISRGPQIEENSWYLSSRGDVEGLHIGGDLYFADDHASCEKFASEIGKKAKAGTSVRCVKGSMLNSPTK